MDEEETFQDESALDASSHANLVNDPDKAELPFGVRLRVRYDGTDFHGWQAQLGQRTPQTSLEEAIAAMGILASRIRGASRTDAGVHAHDQVCAFACAKEIPEHGWVVGLNGHLDTDISVSEAKYCHRLYNPRFDADWKLYRYRIVVGDTRDPMSQRYAWQYGPRIARRDRGRIRSAKVDDFLDLKAMEDAAGLLIGTHDFHAFRAYDDGREHTRRTLHRVALIPSYGGEPTSLAVEIEGDGFMKNMVRILVGTLTDIGRHRLTPSVITRMLSTEGRRAMGGPTAPAHGLCLQRIQLKRGDHKRTE